MSGNVWEWTDSWYDIKQRGRVLRGGSWFLNHGDVRVSIRGNYDPRSSDDVIGCRGVAPVFSGS
jgi:formylglycine-generating enzyme required for sulfatase activity